MIIGKQGGECEQYKEFCEIVKEKDIKVVNAKAGDVIKVEKGVQIKILFPADELIEENVLNNNSLVAKLEYKEFKMLFTGDIEQNAEERILKEYENTDILEATILKIAHHGSKTSTIKRFIQAVKPKIALIGVGENNKFGHPNEDVLNRLKEFRIKIYRTDECGEIRIKTNGIEIKGTMAVIP